MQIDEHFIRIDGRKLWTRQIIRKDVENSPTFVLLHDALGSVAQWKDFPEKISDNLAVNVLVYDRFGHGLSDPELSSPDESFLDREALVILPEVLHQMDIQSPILYGHSDGGTIALIYASRINTRSIILEAAHVMIEEITRKGVQEMMKQKEDIIPLLEKYHGDKTLNLFDYWSGLWSGERMEAWNIEHVLKRIDIPTMIIQGDKDNYGTEVQVEKIRTGISGESNVLMIADCGHAPHKEKTEQVLEGLASFISEYKLTNNDYG